MVDALVDTLEFFPRGLVYVGVGIVVLWLAKLAQELLTPYRINDQLSQKNNTALGLSITGYFLGVITVFVGVLYQPLTVIRSDQWQLTGDFWLDVAEVLLYSLAGILVLNASRIVVDKLVLYKFQTQKEIIEDQNTGSGAVEFAVYIAVGLVIAASIAGTGAGIEGVSDTTLADTIIRSIVFFVLGMIVLILFSLFYELTTSFDIHDEIESDNAAVGIALAGNLVAIGLVIFKAVFGEFIDWTQSLTAFATFAIIGFVLLYIVRLVVDFVLLPGTRVANELVESRNKGIAFIESGVVVSAALILYFAI